MTLDSILAKIRLRSREEWEKLAKEQCTEIRIWIQENGEVAAVGGLFFGILVALAIRLVTVTLVALLGVSLLLWLIALPEAEMKKGEGAHSDDSEPLDSSSKSEDPDPKADASSDSFEH